MTADKRSLLATVATGADTVLRRKDDGRDYSFTRFVDRHVPVFVVKFLLARGLVTWNGDSPSHFQLAATDLGRAVLGLPIDEAAPPPRRARRLKVVYEQQGEIVMPKIRVSGLWLEVFGFVTGRRVELQAEPGRIVISLAGDAEP